MAERERRESRRNPRLRLACSRCQRRKIRCDAQYPTCSNCKKASVACIDGESLRLRDVPQDRENIRLQKRVTWLESIIRERLPDVDLSTEALPDTLPDGPRANGDEAIEQPELSDIRLDEPMLDENSDCRSSQPPNAPAPPARPPDERAHEIGLVAMGSNSDQRYVGPSSGYFLARVLLSRSPRKHGVSKENVNTLRSFAPPIISELVEASQGPLPLPTKAHAVQLSRIYFEITHPQYPILHEPSFFQALDQMYDESTRGVTTDPYILFQIYMVLAISSTVLSSRAKYHVPGESYCLSALQHLNQLNVENSLPGLQCLLLLLIFTLHSPFMRLNVWYLNYQCIAALLDLGLQRNITTSSGISLLNQEMRTRIFWTVFTLDRTIATMMGRPIGLRDEACELRLPQNLDDYEILGTSEVPTNSTGYMALSIHLFKLAKLNSEIKYVANSIVREAPAYAYPPIHDINAWNRGMLDQLEDWLASLPPTAGDNHYMRVICELRYLSIKMLLLRPSPAIPKPSAESLTACFETARQTIRLYDQLYRRDMLVHDWISLHGIVFSTITALYCIRAVKDLAKRTEVDLLMSDLSISLSIISATGEHWSGAKRCRDIIDDLGRSTARWIKGLTRPQAGVERSNSPDPSAQLVGTLAYSGAQMGATGNGAELGPGLAFTPPLSTPAAFQPGSHLDDSFWFNPVDQYEFSDTVNVDNMMQHIFEDFIPQMSAFPAAPDFYNT